MYGSAKRNILFYTQNTIITLALRDSSRILWAEHPSSESLKSEIL
jgi:hypothetical protein